MGKRGPKKTPTQRLANRGSWRALERKGEPQPKPADMMPPPEHLSGEAAAIWIETLPKLKGCGVFSEIDGNAFERYCRTYAAWRRVLDEFEGATEVDWRTICNMQKLDEMVRRLEASFGLNPADRAELNVAEPKEDDGKRNIFKPALVG